MDEPIDETGEVIVQDRENPSDAPSDVHDRLKTLLDVLRVMLPGVEIVFAFLLTVPFSSRAEQITVQQQYTYYVAFTAAAAAVVLLISPSIQHRLEGEGADLERLLRRATHGAVAGMLCLTVVITAVVFLVSDVLFGSAVAAAGATVIAGLIMWLWFAIPLVRRASN